MSTTKQKSIALVNQGGGTRGAFSAGVLDVLMREGISFPYVIGTSAGALVSVDFLSGDLGRNKIITTEVIADKKFLSLHNLIHKGGIFDFHYLEYELPATVPFNEEAFFSSPVRFVCAATGFEDGKVAYFEKGKTPDIYAAIAASASLPLFSKPVEVEGHLYLDGGPTAAIPWRKALEDGNEKLVVVMTRAKDYRKKPSSRLQKQTAKLVYGHHPAFMKAYLDYPLVYNADMEELLRLEKEGKAFLIAPKEALKVSNKESNPAKLRPIYELGVERMEELLPALKEFLSRE